MQALSILMKPSSGMCNMHCDYCFYCDEMEKRRQQSYGFMSEETLKNVIRKTMLQAEGSITYAFQGGEPLLRGMEFFEKALELQKQYNHRHIPVSNAVQTNGTLLNEQWCRFFHDNHFLLGVSVDGIRQTHDFYRHTKGGEPTYDTIVNNIGLLEKFGVEYNILTVVTEQVARNIREIYRDYASRGWNYQQYIECMDPLGEPAGSRSYSLKPETFGVFMTELFDMWYADWKKGQQPYIRKFENYLGILAGHCPEACDQRGICGIQPVVEGDGSVYPCDFYMLDEYYLGNFNTERLKDIDQKRKEIGFVERSMQISAKCKECEYYHICRGGCHRNKIFDVAGDGYVNQYCEGYRYFFAHCLDRMQEIVDAITARRR